MHSHVVFTGNWYSPHFKVVADYTYSLSDVYAGTVEKNVTNDTFLLMDPLTSLETGNFNKVPLYAGTVLHEGNLIAGRK